MLLRARKLLLRARKRESSALGRARARESAQYCGKRGRLNGIVETGTCADMRAALIRCFCLRQNQEKITPRKPRVTST